MILLHVPRKGGLCGIERAILLNGHRVLSEEEKLNCIGLYLDYCGSPSKLTNFDKVYAALPKLVACAVTIAKRQPNHVFTCSKRRRLAAPSLDQFELLHTFDHDKVFCDMYARPPNEMVKTNENISRLADHICDNVPQKKIKEFLTSLEDPFDSTDSHEMLSMRLAVALGYDSLVK